jgi:hypothetical protein
MTCPTIQNQWMALPLLDEHGPLLAERYAGA